MQPAPTFRVVGVRANGMHRVMVQGAKRQDAERVRAELLTSDAFAAVLIVPDDGREADYGSLPEMPMLPE